MNPSLSLVVIRVADMEKSRRFYEALGLQFTEEQHGQGPLHLSAVLGGTVFEIYPLGNKPITSGIRLGFRVSSVSKALDHLRQFDVTVNNPPTHTDYSLVSVVSDPDGHRIEIVEERVVTTDV